MLLKLYDLNHTQIAGLKNHKEAKVESELSKGDKTLSFLWNKRNGQKIPQEYYIRTETDEYVVKENSKASNGYRRITAKLNLEEIEGRVWSEFIVEDCTARMAADYALSDTGWKCVSTVPETRKRKLSLKKVNSYQILEKILDAYNCEVSFDTFQKTVYLKEQIGNDKGVCFIEGFNLKEVTESADTYDYATILIPIGADNLGIEDINGGKNFIENYQYSRKKKAVIWEDTSYTKAEDLLEAAVYKLNEISRPKRSFQIKTTDLSRFHTQYKMLEYSVGDTITIISNNDEIKERQRITKTVQYLENPEKDTMEISNSVLSFEELQRRLFNAADCLENITIGNGTIRGESVDKIDVTQIIGLERYISEDINELRADNIYARTSFGSPYAVIGMLLSTEVEASQLKVRGREDVALSYINELHVQKMHGGTAVFQTVESENISAIEARINQIVSNEISTEYLETHYARIDYANVDTASIEKGFLKSLMVSQGLIADRVSGSNIVATNTLTGVNIFADDIQAGTLSVDRLVFRGSEKSIVYQLNNITGALQSKNVNTLNGEIITPRTITADRIVAKTITASEIDVHSLVVNGFIGTNKLTAQNIDVDKLFAGEIVAAGTIKSRNYKKDASGLIFTMSTGSIEAKDFKVDSAGKMRCTNAVIMQSIYGYFPAPATGGSAVGEKPVMHTNTLENIPSCCTAIEMSSGMKGEMSFKGVFKPCAEFSVFAKFNSMAIFDSNAVFKQCVTMNGGLSCNVISAEKIYGSFVGNVSGNASYANSCGNADTVDGKHASDLLNYNNLTNKPTALPANGGTSEWSNHTRRLDTPNARISIYESGEGGNIRFVHQNNSNIVYEIDTAELNALRVYASTNGGSISNGTIYFSTAGDLQLPKVWFGKSDNIFRPINNNEVNLGHANQRWRQLYVASSSVSTSDRNLKKNILDLDDKYMKFFMLLQPKSFQFIDNTSGRTHIGFISQDVEEAMEQVGLASLDFAGFCKDIKTVPNQEGELCTGEGKPVLDEDGNPEYIYSLRYEEFIALNTCMIQRLYKEIDMIKSKLNE